MQVTIGPASLNIARDPKLDSQGRALFHVSITLLGVNYRIETIRWAADAGSEREVMGYLLAFLGIAEETNYFPPEIVAWAGVWLHEITEKRMDLEAPRITCSYSIVTPESAAAGDAASYGWIDEDGEVFSPEASASIATRAVTFLRSKGAVHASSTCWGLGIWYSDEGSQSPFTGATETRSYHLEGFTEAEERAIYAAITSR